MGYGLRWWATILLALVVGLTIACTRGGNKSSVSPAEVTIEVQVSPQPLQIGPAEVLVTLSDGDGEPISNADLEIEGNMSHAGMQPVIVDVSGVGDGRYLSDGFEFTMGGDWIITVTGALPDGREIDHTFDLAGVAG